MIAYNRVWLDALLSREMADEWRENDLLSNEQWMNIREQNQSEFYTPNVFVRIGLAIFCMILLFAIFGLMAIGTISEAGIGGFCLFSGLIWMAALEFWAIRSARHFRSGMDDMLLYMGLSAILGGVFTLMSGAGGPLTWCCITWPFLAFGSIRYLDRLLTAATYICTLLIILLLVKEIPKLALYLLPFAGMAFSAATWYMARIGQKRFELRFWAEQLALVELLALITFYASGNYFVIQQSGKAFFELEQVPLGGFFWAFTFVVPALYLFFGVRQKDRLLLDVGLACVAAVAFTFRYYFSVLPLPWAATICGAVLFAAAYFSIRYLRQNEGAYTYAPNGRKAMLQEMQEQLIAQTIASQPGVPAAKGGDGFGGGEFGGGGASGEF
jgi:uncharacterized membrane protein YgcG